MKSLQQTNEVFNVCTSQCDFKDEIITWSDIGRANR